MSLFDRLDWLQKAIDILPVGVWLMDREGRIEYGNPAGQRIWGGARYVGPEQFGQYKGWWVDSGTPIAAHEWAAARAISQGETSIDEEVEIECFDGQRKVVLNSAMPVRDEHGAILGAIVVNVDITERKRLEEHLRQIADRDPLTRVLNRRSLYETLASEIQRARRYRSPLSVIMFDIDHFKRINDNYGHAVGDRMLVGTVETVRSELRAGDQLARYGGDEFVIIAPGTDREQTSALAERLRNLIAGVQVPALPPVTCSFGVCQADEEDADGLIARADRLMYEAKQSGRNRVVTG